MKRLRERVFRKNPRRRRRDGERRRKSELRHHCQGHRLAIVIGPKADPSINGALLWIHGLANVQHKLLFDTPIDRQPSFAEPWVPNATTWTKRTNVTADPVQEFVAGCACCCHWDEVIVVCHGRQKNIWYALLRNLPRLLGDRPVRKFVLWMCGAALEFCPLHPVKCPGKGPDGKPDPASGEPVNLFERICHAVRPKSCSTDARCGCTHARCVAFSADSDRTPQHCPDGTEAVKLVCAAWCNVTLPDDSTVPKPARLGLWWNPAAGRWELRSPDGKVREVTIAADGSVTTAAPAGSANVFAGVGLSGDANLQPLATESTAGAISATARMRPTRVEAPVHDLTPAYNGPRRCDHPWHEGCQPD